MRTRMLGSVIPVLGLSLCFAACDTSMEPSGKPVVEAVLNVPFTLSAGQKAVLADQRLSVTFDGVLADGRCPFDAVCIVADNATLSVRAAQEGKEAKTVNLTLLDNPNAVVYEGFGIHIQKLMPLVVSGRTIRPEDYSVELLVDRP